MKKKLLLILSLVSFFLLMESVYARDNTAIPKDVMAVANDGVEWVKTKMENNPNQWGFSDADEIERLALGEGFHVNYIGGDKLRMASGKSLLALIDTSIIDTWEFTLDLDGSPKVFLTVGFEEGEYRVVGFGGDAESFGLAKNNIRSLLGAKGVTENPILIKAGPTYYFVSEIKDNEWVLPVIETYSSDKADNRHLISASVIIDELRTIQNNSIAGERGDGSVSGTEPSAMDDGQIPLFIAIGVVFAIAVISAIIFIKRRSSSHKKAPMM